MNAFEKILFILRLRIAAYKTASREESWKSESLRREFDELALIEGGSVLTVAGSAELIRATKARIHRRAESLYHQLRDAAALDGVI